jgi:UDP-N-acetylmuramoyl-L-alanyl-D-glutamate--2,6-diaminopimelate ligase
MKIKDVLNVSGSAGFKEIKIKGISDDSRLINKGDLFFIIKRKKFNIFSVLKDIEPKICAFVGEAKDKSKLKSIIKKKPLILVNNIREDFYKAVDIFYGFKKDNLKIIGITGTNGKTTTAFLIYHLLKALGQKPSLIGTVKYLIGPRPEKASHTTPDFLSLRKILKRMEEAESQFIVMEVSSHALSQGRVSGLNFSRCLFTNLTRDHLDYHRTIENYFNTKKKLFTQNKEGLALINADDVYGKKIFRQLDNKLSYGIGNGADFRADNIRLNGGGSCFDLIYRNKSYPVATTLCGRHNILNILAAVSLVSSLGFGLSKIIKSLKSFGCVEGRLEQKHKDIFVDYAHTPDALKNALAALREAGYEKIICVFGCGGDRDRGKRRVMGRIAQERADFTFITSDNPRSEDPDEICKQIAKGFKSDNYSILLDRKDAIACAVKLFLVNGAFLAANKKKEKACILIAGKGHEDYQIIGDKKLPFKDSKIISEVIQEICRGGA